MKMKLCVASLLAVLSVGSVWADTLPAMPASPPPPAATNGAIIDQGGNLRYQNQGGATNGQPPAQPTGGAAPLPSQEQLNQKLDQMQQQQQPQPQQQPASTVPNTPGMSATQPTPPMH